MAAELESGSPSAGGIGSSRDWVRVLSAYREPSELRSFFELVSTVVPFVLLWVAAWWALALSPWLALAISALNGGFLVRLFAIQHDCGHNAFFGRRTANDWTGRVLGVLTLTPYAVWRHSHTIHHSTSGNLDRRGIGEVYTMTVREYEAQSTFSKLKYRLYRHPLVMFGIFPAALFLVHNRVPVGFMRSGWRLWASAMGTNLSLALSLGAAVWALGAIPVAIVYLPTVIVAATIGMWLFYIQHQFEETSWDEEADWQMHDAALHGSSHYDLPLVLRWLTANIGIHHIHHLHSRIPFYRLPAVLRDHPDLANVTRIRLLDSLSCLKLRLWDEKRRRLVSFAEARSVAS